VPAILSLERPSGKGAIPPTGRTWLITFFSWLRSSRGREPRDSQARPVTDWAYSRAPVPVADRVSHRVRNAANSRSSRTPAGVALTETC